MSFRWVESGRPRGGRLPDWCAPVAERRRQRCAPRSPRSVSAAAWRRSCRRAPPPASTGSSSSSPTWSPATQSPEEIRALAGRLGPLPRPVPAVPRLRGRRRRPARRQPASRRSEVPPRCSGSASDLMLVCSNVATATIDSDEVSAGQLRRLGDLAARYDVRIAFEALAWGRFIDDYRRSWRIVAARRPSSRRRLPRQLPHPVPRPRPGGDRGHPWRQDLLPPAGRRARAEHGRAVVEPAPSAVPRRRRLRPGRRSSPMCCRTGYDGPAVARGLQRHLPPDRRRTGPRVHALRSLRVAARTRPPRTRRDRRPT